MRHMRKWLALALTLVLALALAVPALAVTATWERMADGNSVLAPEAAYTPESVQAALAAYQKYLDAKSGSQAEKDAYNNEFKPAILALAFKAHAFTDAPRGQWFDKALDFVASTGKMNGVAPGVFDPQGTMTRAMAVTILWRMNGSPAPKSAANFTDVPAGEWYTDAVAWAVGNNITNGTSETTFSPNAPVTREQMATFFSRMILALAGQTAPQVPEAALRSELGKHYSDAASISSYALVHVAICLESGVMKGNADGTFAPAAPITRAQGAQMLMNYYYFLLEQTFRTL